ncbi:MAG: peptide ABC transporter substrate-binding protein [Vulcanimicrobiaceae bacterium]
MSAVAAVGLLAASPAPNVLRYADGMEPRTLAPYEATNGGEKRLAELTGGYLVRYDADGRPRTDLAREIPTRTNGGVSNDGRTITYRLRPKLRWSDGEPLTSADLAFTLRFARRQPAADSFFTAIRAVDTPDARTAVVRLAHVEPDAVKFLFSSRYGTCVLPKHLLARTGELRTSPYASNPVGAGPYRVREFRRGDRVVLEANPYYAGDRPNIERVEYRFEPDANARLVRMLTGELDLSLGIPLAQARHVAGERRLNLQTVPGDSLTTIDLNLASPVLADVRVRRALRLALDRPRLFERLMHGEGSRQESLDVPVDTAYVRLPEHRYDVVAAERLLDAAGYRRDAGGIRARDGRPLRIRWAYVASPTMSGMTELVRTDLARVGVVLEAKAYPGSLLLARAQDGGIMRSGTFDAAPIIRYPTAGYVAASYWYGCRSSWLRLCSPAVDRELDALHRAIEPAAQRAHAARLYRLLDDEVPAIALWQPATPFVASTRLKGFRPGPFTTFDDVARATIAH